MSSRRTPEPWKDDAPLMGDNAPKNDGSILYLIEYLLTVYKRFGNTSVVIERLRWGASALWAQDEFEKKIEAITAERDEARRHVKVLAAMLNETVETNDLKSSVTWADEGLAAISYAEKLP